MTPVRVGAFAGRLKTLRHGSHLRARAMSTSPADKTLIFEMRPPPPKNHLHRTLPDDAFPAGFLLSGAHVGVKKSKAAEDLALILTSSPAHRSSAAAVFTQNSFAAAPVRVSASVLAAREGRGVRGVVVNSGCANAVTGQKGEEDAWAMVRAAGEVGGSVVPSTATATAGENGADSDDMLVMSTGVIGVRLPIEKILAGIRAMPSTLGASSQHWDTVARAFLTTDTFPKLRARSFAVTHADGTQRTYKLAGMSKGAGMIHPRMGPSVPSAAGLHATLLSAIMTDAHVAPNALQSALEYASARSFNAISVDGDMSTNDTVVVLASGADTNAPEIDNIDEAAYVQFRDALTDVAKELAQLVVRDGEGATKFVTMTVKGTKRYEDAHTIASRISTSALVKTALYGEDANWGRILASLGSLQQLSAPIDPSRVSVSFVPTQQSASGSTGTQKPLLLLRNGEPQPLDEEHASALLAQTDIEILLDVGLGDESAQYWTCDFSYEYVRINGDYRS